jgi:hypothetical protein
MWLAWHGSGLGHLRLAVRESGVVADGLVLGVDDAHPFRLLLPGALRPLLERAGRPCGRPRRAAEGRAVLRRGGQLDRTRRTGRVVSKGLRLRGHLRDAVHELAAHTQARPRTCGVAGIALAYLEGAELQPWPGPQRYTRLQTGEGGATTYRFVSLDGGFRADLPVDLDDLVLDYPGRFRRVFP